ncbi:MAG: Na+/H+ antiporter NhaA [Anaerolineales bacterium]|nr:Na+/H+ antiporter NhaA [Anaerolineales bacterium]
MTTTITAKLTPPVSVQDHIKGPTEATVDFVEYGDYECPHCRQAHAIVIELQERLGDRFRYTFRNFPITSVHPHAQLAAEAAEAAAAQGKFWEMHTALFENQGALDEEHLIQYAAELGLDTERFQKDLQEHTFAERVKEDFLSGVRSGVNGTPTFFINGLRYDGVWDIESLKEEIEKPLGVQVRNLFSQFTRWQASGGILLVITTILALLLANSALSESYFSFWEMEAGIAIGNLELSESLLHWINDGLMVIYFFVVGLEIKREVTIGELASPRRAALPIMAAIGGMLMPAIIYTIFNFGTEAQNGWAIPTATDIAFTLGILLLLGSRVPLALKVFFTALAIADDLGAVIVIALFYTEEIVWISLAIGGLIFLVLLAINWLGVRRTMPYVVLGIGLWLAFLESGVHPTIAGVLLAFTIPARSKASSEAFLAQCISVLGGVEPTNAREDERAVSNRQQAAAQTLETMAERMQTPAQRLEHDLTPWATYLILPLFALANAGVILSGDPLQTLTSPVALGIILGLFVGKPIGLSIFAWIAVRSGIAEMPTRVTWAQLISSASLAGIGFTMSLFIAGSAFNTGPLLSAAKIGILAGSLLAGVAGTLLLYRSTAERDRTTELTTAVAAN